MLAQRWYKDIRKNSGIGGALEVLINFQKKKTIIQFCVNAFFPFPPSPNNFLRVYLNI
jgi:hypothetical protein